MGLNVRPAWRLLANRADITATVAERLISLRFTVREGVDGQWVINRVEQSLDGSGLSTSIEAERANE